MTFISHLFRMYSLSMSRLFALFLLLFVSTLSAAPSWKWTHRVALEKDEFAYIYTLRKGESEAYEDELRFRWTLYDDTNLVFLTNFRKFPSQYILSLRRGLNGMVQQVSRTGVNQINDRVELYFYFTAFDSEKRLAYIDVFLSDPASRVELRYVDPREARKEEQGD